MLLVSIIISMAVISIAILHRIMRPVNTGFVTDTFLSQKENRQLKLTKKYWSDKANGLNAAFKSIGK